jgi:putative oligomerization/nucleic acid binding protein
MLLRPLRRAPMMLGGVGYQVGLDEARRKHIEAQRRAPAQAPAAPDVVRQLEDLKALLDSGALTPEEFQVAKRKVLDG